MFDLIQLKLLAGNGGNGHISFRREKYAPKGGPDGGDGGDGGNIIFRSSNQFSTLQHLQNLAKIQAQNGKSGSKRKKTGAAAQDVLVEVPVGTRVIIGKQNAVAARRLSGGQQKIKRQVIRFTLYDQAYSDDKVLLKRPVSKHEADFKLISVTEPANVLCQFNAVGQEILICQGGFGGGGNVHFKSSTVTTPRMAELGSVGERMEVTLELRLLADVGLVGQPNVGKSTLLSLLTAARPKIGNYPFTTIKPNLGILKNSQLVIADIPGLVEGASAGKGLGSDFLRHISHCQTICLMVSVAEDYLTALNQGIFGPAIKNLQTQLKMLKQELKVSMPDVLLKKNMVILTKTDLYPQEFTTKAIQTLQKSFPETFAISSADGKSLKLLVTGLNKLAAN